MTKENCTPHCYLCVSPDLSCKRFLKKSKPKQLFGGKNWIR
jgi:hypothetical protein